MNLRSICSYASYDSATRTSIWEPGTSAPTRVAPTTSEVLAAARPHAALSNELETAIVAVTARPLASNETLQSGNDARERELVALFSRLSIVEARELGRRLDRACENDVVVQALGRLVPARRERLRRYLADTPRRNATGR